MGGSSGAALAPRVCNEPRRAPFAGSDEVQTVVPLGWGDDRYRLYASPDGPALVWYVVWDDARSAGRFLRAAGPALGPPPFKPLSADRWAMTVPRLEPQHPGGRFSGGTLPRGGVMTGPPTPPHAAPPLTLQVPLSAKHQVE